jgi:hypothetical protein
MFDRQELVNGKKSATNNPGSVQIAQRASLDLGAKRRPDFEDELNEHKPIFPRKPQPPVANPFQVEADAEEVDSELHVRDAGISGNGYSAVSVNEEKADPQGQRLESAEYYRDNNMINLNSDADIHSAASEFRNLSDSNQSQLINHLKSLIDISRNDPEPLAHALTNDGITAHKDHDDNANANTPDYNADGDEKPKTVWMLLPTMKQKEILNYYIKSQTFEYRVILAHGYIGYAGEAFYLNWDRLARMEVYRTFLPKASELSNEIFNDIMTPPIILANVVYIPGPEAIGYMRNKMLDPEKAFTNQIRKNKLLSLMFLLYAFGGGYIEIVDIDQWLADHLGQIGKLLPELLLLYAAIAYYAAFNLADTIEGFDTWMKLPSLLKKAFARVNEGEFNERFIALFGATHETLTFVERILRMSYGGWEAGNQQLGPIAAFILAAAVGIGTAPVALATRGMAARNIYNLSRFKKTQINAAIAKFNLQYADNPIRKEVELFLTPSLFLLAPAAMFAYDYGSYNIDAPRSVLSGLLYGLTSTLVLHAALGLRYPAKRREIVSFASDLESVPAHTIKPNKVATAISTFVNMCDTSSRIFTMAYTLEQLFPGTFNNDNEMGQKFLFCALSLESFISISQFLYQRQKSAIAFAGLSPRFFSHKVEPEMHGTPLLGGAEPSNDSLLSQPAAVLEAAAIEDEGNDDDQEQEERPWYRPRGCSLM